MKILYFHGFASSGASGTVELLRKLFPEIEIVAPDIPVDPVEALPYLQQLTQDEQPDLIIGTSMGAMYAQQMFGFKKICVNPAFNMSTMSKVLKTGTFKFLNGRKDHQKEFRITRNIIQHFNQMERQQFKGITEFDKENTYGLFGIHDTTTNCYDLFKKHYANAQRFDGEHHLNEKALRHAVLPLVKQILGI
ncbi:MAG: YqiA/YcfP family alpha/beta fold hydrolase [Prevotellaceae bacterium]|nr:YqiA/YcfP family alpha/beta fold hydrolase [Prevotellaceae bacterium]